MSFLPEKVADMVQLAPFNVKNGYAFGIGIVLVVDGDAQPPFLTAVVIMGGKALQIRREDNLLDPPVKPDDLRADTCLLTRSSAPASLPGTWHRAPAASVSLSTRRDWSCLWMLPRLGHTSHHWLGLAHRTGSRARRRRTTSARRDGSIPRRPYPAPALPRPIRRRHRVSVPFWRRSSRSKRCRT